jgi:hypothetical protein
MQFKGDVEIMESIGNVAAGSDTVWVIIELLVVDTTEENTHLTMLISKDGYLQGTVRSKITGLRSKIKTQF